MSLSITDILTVGGATVIVLILTQVLKTAVSGFDAARYGALFAIVAGIAVVALANASAAMDVRLGWGEAVLTGLLAGAAASGIYDAGKGTAKALSSDTPGG